MPNIQDYVLWRGDLPIRQVPLCDVDALLLSYLSYMRYDGIVGDSFEGEGVRLADAAQELLDRNERDKMPLAYNAKEDRKLLAALIQSVRFADMRLVGYVNQVDDKAEERFFGRYVPHRGRLPRLSPSGERMTRWSAGKRIST